MLDVSGNLVRKQKEVGPGAGEAGEGPKAQNLRRPILSGASLHCHQPERAPPWNVRAVQSLCFTLVPALVRTGPVQPPCGQTLSTELHPPPPGGHNSSEKCCTWMGQRVAAVGVGCNVCLFVCFVCQGLSLARQALYHLSYISSPFFLFKVIFQKRS
jgi:hypothetical protein